MEKNENAKPENFEIVSRSDYQEILLARMAAGDLYANEVRMKLKRIDMALDALREKPLYKNGRKNDGE